MTDFPDFPVLDSPARCAALWSKYPEKVVGLWATGCPRQNVDVLWRLREELLKIGVPVVFFFNVSALPMLRSLLGTEPSIESGRDLYQLDDPRFFHLLSFVDVLVANDTFVGFYGARHIRAKLVGLPHCANVTNPTFWNYYYDYFVSDKNELRDFDYSFYINRGKIRRNSSFTQLVVGYPKLDLLLEERKKSYSTTYSVLLIYLVYVDYSVNQQNISPEKYVEIWSDVISAFLEWRSDGMVVFRPTMPDRQHPLVREILGKFAESGRVFLDDDDDNKFWLARAKYFVTDLSQGYINFSMTAMRPSIRMFHRWEEHKPKRDEWGWVIATPAPLVSLLEQMDRDEKCWARILKVRQKCEMPTLGRNFTLLAGMVKRILQDDDDPMWLKLDKGNTPCNTTADMLKIVAKWVKHSNFCLVHMAQWVNMELIPLSSQHTPKIWLLLLRSALLSSTNNDAPNTIAINMAVWLDNALAGVPFVQCVGLLRHLLRTGTQKSATALLITVTSVHVSGARKKRALFFLLMEWARYDPEVVRSINVLAEKMPQHFSRPVLDKLNRYLPLIMKVPRPLRRLGARFVGLKKPLAKKYWQAHRALA